MEALTDSSQFRESTVLYEALSGVDAGFYLDVGAGGMSSNTRMFYDLGWSGVCCDPAAAAPEAFADRPRDEFHPVAVTAEDHSTVTFWDAGQGLSSTVYQQGEPLRVPTRRVDSLVGDRIVHFASIDVEGGERGVLESFGVVRPWYLVIEATVPNTSTPTHQNWEDLLGDYRFDGMAHVNRFYSLPHLRPLNPR